MASEHKSCQSCSDSLISPLFCFSCNSLQTISDDIDHFEVMGMPHCFEIDSEELENLYQRLTLEMHPDFFGAASEEQKRLSEKSSVMLNAAYSTLRKPASRQESLDEILESGDQSALCKMNDDLQDSYNFIESNYASLFKKLETSPENTEILQQLQTQLNTERYLRRLLDRINS